MEQSRIFRVVPLDAEALCPQVSRALEKRMELHSRQTCPGMWRLTDRLNAVPKVSQTVRERRRKWHTVLGALNWGLGVFLLMPALLEPQELWGPLLAGAAGFGIGVSVLWRTRRTFLGVLSLVCGGILCVGALGNPVGLGALLPLGAANGVIGAAALLTRKRKRKNPYERQARQVLSGKGPQQSGVYIALSDQGVTVGEETIEDVAILPYASFDYALETEDLLLLLQPEQMMILAKSGLRTGTFGEVRAFLRGQLRYEGAWEDPEAYWEQVRADEEAGEGRF